MSTPDSESIEPEQTVPGDENPQTPTTADDDTQPSQTEPEPGQGSPSTGTADGPPAD